MLSTVKKPVLFPNNIKSKWKVWILTIGTIQSFGQETTYSTVWE